MTFTVYYSNPELTTAAGFGKVAELPCIFDSRPGYHRLGSQYLIDRGLGIWSPDAHGRASRESRPTEQTMLSYANWLINFLEWADTREVNLQTCDYSLHVQGRYQSEMLSGHWSRDGRPLKPGTVNPRVQQACDFLSWMADKGYRASFAVPFETIRTHHGSATSAVGHRSKEVMARQGKVRQNKRHLRMPTDAQIKDWLKAVYEKHGPTKGLMCETVLLTAMRREEVACWRIDTLPEDPSTWHRNNLDAPPGEQQVLVTIKFGAKGKKYGMDHGDKVGPERSIWVPLHLAQKLHDYRMRLRNPALKKWISAATSVAEKKDRIANAVHLFIDEQTGDRISGKNLYDAWTGVDLQSLIFKGWSPHLGRDWWACSILWREMKKHQHLMETGMNTAAALLESTALSIIRLQIQPQLGHSSPSTTMIYLQWVMDMVGAGLSIDYEAEHDKGFGITR